MSVVGITLYFAAQDAAHGWEIWSWDGTNAPQVAWETSPGSGSFNPAALTRAGTNLYFTTSANLWSLKNATASAVATPDFTSRTLMQIFSEQDQLFAWFREDSAVTLHYSLWQIDGLTMQRIPGEFNRPARITDSEILAPGEFIFLADEVSVGLEPFLFRASTGTATLTRNVNDGTYDGSPSPIIAAGGRLGMISTVFVNKSLRRSLVTTDGQGTPVISDSVISFEAGASGSDLYYIYADSISDIVVHDWNGTTDQTLATMPPGIIPNLPGYRVGGGFILFGNTYADSNAGAKLYVAQNGTLSEGFGDFRSPSQFVQLNGVLYFASSSGSDGAEVWMSDGTLAGTYQITNLSSLQTSVTIHSLFVDSELLSFGYRDEQSVERTGFSDGTPDGTLLLQSLVNVPATARLLGMANGLLLFEETAGNGGLWATDGTAAGTRLLADQFTTTRAIPATDGRSLWLVASGAAFSSRISLWKSDGTSVGTTAISGLPFAESISELGNFAAIEDRLLFTRTSRSSDSHEIWRADGTPSGTVQLRYSLEGTLKLDTPSQFTRYSHGIAFAGRTALTGVEPFRIDTTIAVAPPTNLAFQRTGDNADLVWPDVSGAIQYEIWMQNVSKTDAPVINQRVNDLGVRISDLATPGDVYRVWVRSLPVLGKPSVWSASKDFVLGSTPMMYSIPSITTNTKPTLRWAGPTDVTSFELWVDNKDAKTRPIYEQGLTKNFFVATTSLDPAKYSAWVRGTRVDGTKTRWSPVADFTIYAAAIPLTSGGGELLGSQPSFTWAAVPGATGYDVQITPVGSNSLIYRSNNVQGTRHTLKNGLASGQYKVFVRAIKGSEPLSVWGSGSDLQVKLPPTGLTRTGASVAGDVGATWNAVPSAVSYTIELINTFTGNKVQADKTQSITTFNPSPALPAGQYSIRVRSNYATGIPSHWSPALAIDALRSAAVTITSPNAATADATPTIAWTATPGANGYEIFVSRQGSSTAVYTRTGITTTSHRIDVPLTATMHRIWVRPIFADGSRGIWGAGQPLQIGPAPVVTQTARVFAWPLMNEATQYEFWLGSIAASGTVTRVLYDSKLLTTSYTLPATFPKGRYQLWVRAIRVDNGASYFGNWGTTGAFDLT